MRTSLTVRPFHADDRDQLTDLVNQHIAAVVPGISVSVNTVLSHLKRQPDEFIVDPWVSERTTLVAEQRGHIIAAAHLLRYAATPDVGPCYRDAGEINWFLCSPPASFWSDSTEAGDALLTACLALLDRWRTATRLADGALPAPGVYGVPEQWPHIRAALERAGFTHTGGTETILIAETSALPSLGQPPLPGLTVRRTLGECGTRLSACLDGGEVAGFAEVDTAIAQPERLARLGGWADLGNLHVAPAHTHTGLDRWLLGQAAAWLRLAGTDRLLAYADDPEETAALTAAGFQELTRTARGWQHHPSTTP